MSQATQNPNRLHQTLNRMWHSHLELTVFQSKMIGVAFLFIAGVVAAISNYYTAAGKTMRQAAATEKYEILTGVDSNKYVGRTILNENGIIVSWNKGMTAIAGFTSKETVGTKFGEVWPKEGLLYPGAFRNTVDSPWTAFANVELLDKQQVKHTLHALVLTNEPPAKPGRIIVFVPMETLKDVAKVQLP